MPYRMTPSVRHRAIEVHYYYYYYYLAFNFINDKQQQYIEIAWQTVNKPLADCYALGGPGPPTVSIAV